MVGVDEMDERNEWSTLVLDGQWCVEIVYGACMSFVLFVLARMRGLDATRGEV